MVGGVILAGILALAAPVDIRVGGGGITVPSDRGALDEPPLWSRRSRRARRAGG